MLQSCTLSNIRLNLAHPRVSPLFCMSTKHVDFIYPIGSPLQVALCWLEERDFRKVERDMISLGLRHRRWPGGWFMDRKGRNDGMYGIDGFSPNRFTCMGFLLLSLGRMILTVSPGLRPQSVGSGWSHDFLHLSFICLPLVSHSGSGWWHDFPSLSPVCL